MNIKETIRQFILTRLGVNSRFSQTNEKIDCLYYYLNQLVDITALPPTKDEDLRILQKCDALLMAIFHKMCDKYGLTYWLDYGTLLGATRHKGFIPWDDDTDVTMLREDFERAYSLLPPLCEKYGLKLYEESDRLCFHYKHSETGIWLDVFPLDTYCMDKANEKEKKQLQESIIIYKSMYDRHLGNCPQLSYKELTEQRNRIVGKGSGNNIFYWNLSFGNIEIYEQDMLFPCIDVMFEDFKLKGPADIEKILTQYYDDYMSFPKSGILHHGSAMGRAPLSQWAKMHNIDMHVIQKDLERIYNSFA